MDAPITKRKVITSFIWSLSEKVASQGLQFVISIILARILIPDDYGIIALLTIFIQIANIFIIDGFNSSLIQKRDSDDLDFSSVFYFTCAISVFLYVSVFFAAPLIARFYKLPVLTPLTRLLALSFFYTPLASCQYAYIEKHFMFKIYLLRSLICMVASGSISIFMAFKGFGVYSLVVHSLTYGTLNSVVLWFSIDWRPKFMFSFSRIKSLFSYGWKFVCVGLMGAVFRNIHTLIIGRTYSAEQLGFYNRGQQFPSIIANNFTPALKNVVFPTFSAQNDTSANVKNMLRMTARTNAYILLPLLFGMAAVARPLILLLLTEKWSKCIPFMQLSCFYFAFYYINDPNIIAINSMGRSDIFLKYEIIKKIIIVLSLIITIPLGIYHMAVGQVIVTAVSSLLNFIPSKNILGYTYAEQLRDITPSLALSLLMGTAVYTLSYLPLANLPMLILQLILGIVVYLGLSMILRLREFRYIMDMIKLKLPKI